MGVGTTAWRQIGDGIMALALPDGFTPADFEHFYQRYHSHTPEADLAENPVEVQQSATARHLSLGFVRPSGSAAVSVFTPSSATDGWGGNHSVVQVVLDDMPFVVDSLNNALVRASRGIVRVLHPILHVRRDSDGRLLRVLDADAADATAESWCEFVVQKVLTPAAHVELENTVRAVLSAVGRVNADWRAMQAQALALSDSQADLETSEFLRWLADDNFTFLGYREYSLADGILRPLPETSRGLLQGGSGATLDISKMPAAAQKVALDTEPLILTKSGTRSLVHRSTHPEYIGIKVFGADGKVTGEHRFIGLLSRRARAQSVLNIPVLRKLAQRVLDGSGWQPGSHSYKDILQFIESLPRELLLQLDAQWLSQVCERVLNDQNRRESFAYVHADVWGRFAELLIFMPRDVYNTNVRQALERRVASQAQVSSLESTVQLDASPQARLHISVRLSAPVADWQPLLDEVAELATSWVDGFAEVVIEQAQDDSLAAETISNWSAAFDSQYQAAYSPADAWEDLQCARSGGLQMRLVLEPELRLRIFSPETPLQLFSLLPVLAAFGLAVSDERPHLLRPRSGQSVWLHDLGIHADLGEADQSLLLAAIAAAVAGEVEVDDLLRLVISAGLSSAEVALLRTYVGYVSQWSSIPAASIREAMNAYPQVARMLVGQFRSLLDPSYSGDFSAVRLNAAIDRVVSLVQDQALRAVSAAIAATVRSNFCQPARPALAIKVKPQRIAQMPEPRPFAEIWVESPRVRGVHLRFGAVARGGLRWSDRRDDLRTEIMGLVRAQVVKNSVIVPTGAKGGFVGKQLPDPSAREQWQAGGVAAYEEFINALLDVTDNRVSGVVVPADTVRLDGDDPYLVVAADKGTATFSDIANRIATSRGFWLGDAFASGGSVGYDHKAMGITARGAWESVRQHFELLGLDCDSDPITAVGIGDMSGDVFGNGLLRSRSVRLIAAFDHRDIFIDPNPDAASAFAERERLFALPRSSWADYTVASISAGGGVYSRSEKKIELSDAAATALGMQAGVYAPNEIISGILRAPVDLLWNGGIGTYVKATSETHAQVGDRANDAIRINASELRARVVGEGGNLGFTQEGRIEAALHGVALNSDAIDNSAGVDTSDHEVNLKILLAERAGLAMEERNELLASLTDDVAEAVLADNIAQNQVLTIASTQGSVMLSTYARLFADWESSGVLQRQLEGLPSDDELLTRQAAGGGLTRPELGVLLAHAKLQLTAALTQSYLLDAPWAEQFLLEYFPSKLRAEFLVEMTRHPLRREIIATAVANHVVNNAGITAAWRAAEETGAALDEVARAFMLAEQICDMRNTYTRIAMLGPNAWPARITLMRESRRLLDRAARWLLANRAQSDALLRDRQMLADSFAVVQSRLAAHLKGDELARWRAQADSYVALGAPEELAEHVAGLLDSYAAFDLADLAGSADVADWSETYFALSDRLGGDVILTQISALPRGDRWQTMARAALRADMYAVLAAVTRPVVIQGGSLSERMARFESLHSTTLARVTVLLRDIKGRPSDIAAISVALRTLRGLVNVG